MKIRIIALCLTLLFLLVFCGKKSQPEPPAPPTSSDSAAVSPPSTPEVSPGNSNLPISPSVSSAKDHAVDALMAEMSLVDKVGQIFFVRCPEEGAIQDIYSYHLGGYLLFGRDFKDSSGNWLNWAQLSEKISSYQRASSIPLLIGADEEGGTVARVTRNPHLFSAKRQSPQQIFAAGGMDAIVQDTLAVNGSLLQLGINVNLSPVADVSTNVNDFIYDRTFGQDATATADYIAAAVDAMDTAGIGSVLKHFPGYGSNVDTHTGSAVDERPYDRFVSEDFLPFSSGIAAGADSILVSHNIVTCMDADLPASLSPEIHRILREELGFNGVIITDDLLMDAVRDYAEDGSVAVLAVLAGNDLIITTDYRTQIPQVIAAVETGEIPMDLLDRAVRRVLSWKYDLGLLG